MDEDGGRVPSDSVSGCGAYWAGRVLCGYGLQFGADGEPVVVPGAPGRSSPCDLPGRLGGSSTLCDDSDNPTYISNEPRVGYRMPTRDGERVEEPKRDG